MSKSPLRQSIEHWQKNVAAEKPEEAKTGRSACALCRFYWGYHFCSSKCPIKKKTGQNHCIGTPYRKAEPALQSWETVVGEHEPADVVKRARTRWRRAAGRELRFLESLLRKRRAKA